MTPAIITILGVTGDLAKRKLLPALYQLFQANLLGSGTVIVGSSRRQVDATTVLAQANIHDEAFAKLFRMIQFDPAAGNDHAALKQTFDAIEQGQPRPRLVYVSIPPNGLVDVVRSMGAAGLNDDFTRLLIEKPYGHDLASAETLTQELAAIFNDENVYRIDHFAAKEAIQNLTVFRRHNALFERIFNEHCVEAIEIEALEALDIEGRANFYEQTGALRDLIQSHLLHVLSEIGMTLPTGDDLHAARQVFLESIRPADPQYAVRGQYQGYRQEVEDSASAVETFAAVTLFSDDPRWQNVPFKLTTGKALASKKTRITVHFKNEISSEGASELVFAIDPEETISLTTIVKQPGFDGQAQQRRLELDMGKAFNERQPAAYERIFYDALRGQRELFLTAEEALASWRIVQPLLDNWSRNDDNLQLYAKGSNGPDGPQLVN